MILRVVLGAVLTAALLGVTAPALSAAQADATDAAVERRLTTLAERLQTMVATDDATPDRGARRIAEVRLPERTLTSAGVGSLRFHSREGVGVASWRAGDASAASSRLVGVPIRPATGSLTLREPGVHRLAFGLRTRDGRTVVTVRRLAGAADSHREDR